MHRTGGLVHRLVAAHRVEHRVQRVLREPYVLAQFDGVDFLHQVAEHRALAAAGGDGAFGHFSVEVVDAAPGGDRGGVGVPVHLHRGDVRNRRHQPLVAQVAEHQRLRRLAEGHQGDEFAFVQVDRERMFARDRRADRFAAFVDRLDLEGGGTARRSEFRQGEFGTVHRLASGVSHRCTTSRPCAPSRSRRCGSRSSGRRAPTRAGRWLPRCRRRWCRCE